MSLSEFAVTVLMSLTSLFGVGPLPSSSDPASPWTVDQPWQESQGIYKLEASSEAAPRECAANPDGFIEFPMIIHGAHEALLDGKKVEFFGDPTFRTVRSFYGTMLVSCQNLLDGKKLTWRAYSYSQYFARVTFWPKFRPYSPNINFFQETLNAVVSGGLLMLALISGFVFWGQVSHLLTLSLVGTGAAFAAYFIATTPLPFNLHFPMLYLHKLADFSLWIGTLLLFNTFRVIGLVGKGPFAIYCAHVGLAVLIIALGTTGDVIQLGTTLPFGMFFGVMGMGFCNLLQRSRAQGIHRTFILQILSLSSFILMSGNDVLVVLGLIQGPVLLSIGVLGGVTFLALDVHERITEAYRERDYLRHHLEDEVIKKTAEISAKTEALEEALDSLRLAQADLIQSSKMASLGMVAAGIAHEINNSLNYVNGAITPLRRLFQKSVNFEYTEQANKLMGVMQEGLRLTFEIMNSLRTYTGLNHASMREHRVIDLVRSTMAILNNRVPEGVKVEINVPDDLEVAVNGASINQVLVNLVINALDAIGDRGLIQITAEAAQDAVCLRVRDDGPGVPRDIRDKVFDPFFTTKDVGKGTGLGLHISRREVARHGGSLLLDSDSVQGSTFTITLPKHPHGGASACSP
ncbi:sensor histidine kinase [Oligoflexus tunisiensis]|uniref:sensor histidine kinase n=1 Tax=Oligoflexus tunisiensis TaxID=708132 RepID=UPI00114D1A17|nr:ATP-binding protein [Oligoflexus tunisiensis]